MESRNILNNKLVNWIEKRVKSKYADDISMVLIYGSYVNGTANKKSDVDCYFIPKNDNGYNMAVDFILEETGYDIFPMSWERVEGISKLQETLLPCVGDVKILYYNSEEDLKRFEQLQSYLYKNLNNTEYIKKIISNKLNNACDIFSQITASSKTVEIRKLSGNIIMILAEVIALYNNDYFHFGLKKQIDDLQNKFKDIPKDFIKEYLNIVQVEKDEDYINHSLKMLEITSEYVGLELTIKKKSIGEVEHKQINLDYNQLSGFYEEVSSTFNKIYICCESDNYVLAFLSAVCLQNDLDEAVEFGGYNYDLLSSYKYTELSKLYNKAKEIELEFVNQILNGGGKIKKYNNFEEFERANL